MLKVVDYDSTKDARIQFGNQAIEGGKVDVKERIKRGPFKIQKNDFHMGTNRAEGDNNLSAGYAVVNKNDYAVTVDTNGDGVIDMKTEMFQPGEVIRDRSQDDSSKKMQISFMTDANGNYSSPTATLQELPYGNYQIIEVQAPKNYYRGTDNNKDSFINITIGEDGQLINRAHGHEADKADSEVFTNVPATTRIELYKHVNAKSGSEVDNTAEDGAQFLVILTSKLNELYGGDMQKAWNALKDQNGKDIRDDKKNVLLAAREFSVITTGTEKNKDGDVMHGYGISGELATGNYTIMQFKSGKAKGYDPDDLKMADEPETLDLKANEKVNKYGYTDYSNKDTYRMSVTNDELVYNLRMIKEDAATGKTVTLNSASFMVYLDSDGDGKLTDADLKYKSVMFNGDIDYKYYQKDSGVTKIANGVQISNGNIHGGPVNKERYVKGRCADHIVLYMTIVSFLPLWLKPAGWKAFHIQRRDLPACTAYMEE